MKLEEALQTYRECKPTELSPCDDCPIGKKITWDFGGTVLTTMICSVLDYLEKTLKEIEGIECQRKD